MDNRIQYVEKDKTFKITIKALMEEKQQQMLLVWIVLFSVCGILIFSQFGFLGLF